MMAPVTRFEMQRVTAAYSESEDRLQLLGEGAPGCIAELWLTRRLAEKLISHLKGLTTKPSTPKEQVDQPQPSSEDSLAPVTKAGDAAADTQFLVTSIDISEIQHHVSLVFHGGQGSQPAQFTIAKVALHSWVTGITELLRKNGWLENVATRPGDGLSSALKTKSTTVH